jgi:hypothetical protein
MLEDGRVGLEEYLVYVADKPDRQTSQTDVHRSVRCERLFYELQYGSNMP